MGAIEITTSVAGATLTGRVDANVADIIWNAQQSPLGILALFCLALAALAFFFFNKSDLRTKLIVFFALLLSAAAAYGAAILAESRNETPRVPDDGASEGNTADTQLDNITKVEPVPAPAPAPANREELPARPSSASPSAPPELRAAPHNPSAIDKVSPRLKTVAEGRWRGERDRACSVRLEIGPGQIIWIPLPEDGRAKQEIFSFDPGTDGDQIKAKDERGIERYFEFGAGTFRQWIGNEGRGEDFLRC
jgi:hypothetical protein